MTLKSKIRRRRIGRIVERLLLQCYLFHCYFYKARCPVGTYYDKGVDDCLLCPEGTYSPIEGALQCQACPEGTWTVGNRQENFTACTGDYRFFFNYCNTQKKKGAYLQNNYLHHLRDLMYNDLHSLQYIILHYNYLHSLHYLHYLRDSYIT